MCCSQINVSFFVIKMLKWSQHKESLVSRITIKTTMKYYVFKRFSFFIQLLSTRKSSVNYIDIDKDFSNVNCRSIYIHHNTKLYYSSEIILWQYIIAIKNVNSSWVKGKLNGNLENQNENSQKSKTNECNLSIKLIRIV